MKDFLNSKKTTIVGVIAILGLIYHAYTNGGFSVQDFLMLVVGIGFFVSKDADVTHSDSIKKDIKSVIGSRPSDR